MDPWILSILLAQTGQLNGKLQNFKLQISAGPGQMWMAHLDPGTSCISLIMHYNDSIFYMTEFVDFTEYVLVRLYMNMELFLKSCNISSYWLLRITTPFNNKKEKQTLLKKIRLSTN